MCNTTTRNNVIAMIGQDLELSELESTTLYWLVYHGRNYSMNFSQLLSSMDIEPCSEESDELEDVVLEKLQKLRYWRYDDDEGLKASRKATNLVLDIVKKVVNK